MDEVAEVGEVAAVGLKVSGLERIDILLEGQIIL